MSSGNPARMVLATALHVAPPAPAPDGSLSGWLWLTVALALLVAGGVVLASRR